MINDVYHILEHNEHFDALKLIQESQKKIRSNDGFTPLMEAVLREDIEVVKDLIPLQAGLQTKDGSTTLMFAASHGYADIVELLMENESGIISIRGGIYGTDECSKQWASLCCKASC